MEGLTRFVPLMTHANHKGVCGKIAVIGGSPNFTGAPYFAGSTVLRAGGDLSHIWTHVDAAVPIKCYSPDLIVHPINYTPEDAMKIFEFPVDAYVIGCGLGRDPGVVPFLKECLNVAMSTNKPLVLDADSLYFIAQDPELIIRDFPRNIILTPNGMELIRLREATGGQSIVEIARRLGVSILAKGNIDIFSDGHSEVEMPFPGIPRRVGGQGDILAGALGLFCSYCREHFVAAAAASELVRAAASRAFGARGRGMITSDILNEIPMILPASWTSPVVGVPGLIAQPMAEGLFMGGPAAGGFVPLGG